MGKKIITVFAALPVCGCKPSNMAKNVLLTKKVCELTYPNDTIKMIDHYNIQIPDDSFHDWSRNEKDIYYLIKGLELMCGENLLVVFAGDVMDSNECMIEYEMCCRYGMKYLTINSMMSDLAEYHPDRSKELDRYISHLTGISDSDLRKEFNSMFSDNDNREPKTESLHFHKFKSFKELMEEEDAAVNEYREYHREVLSRKNSSQTFTHVEKQLANHKLNELVDKINYIRDCMEHALEHIRTEEN